jgi:hypothetical protein
MTDEGPIVAPDPNEVDDLGYKKHGALPSSQVTVKWMDVLSEFKRLSQAGISHEEITARIFALAYPASGMPESTIAAMLKANGILVPSRIPRKSESETRVEF